MPPPLVSYIGDKLHQRRKKAGITLSQFAAITGLSHQQLHKYEKGKSSIPAHRLYELASALGVPITYFFEGYVAPSRSQDTPGAIRVLLIEDDPADAILMREALKKSAYPCSMEVMANGRQALDYLRNAQKAGPGHLPDIIFLDLQIPVLSGFVLLKELKQDRDLRNIPIIIITNSMNPADVSHSYQEHANGFLQKQANAKEFSQNIVSTIDYWVTTMMLPSIHAAIRPSVERQAIN